MDPYLESRWVEVHTVLISQTWRTLNRILPDGYAARVEERIAVEVDAAEFARVGPDVRVVSSAAEQALSRPAAAVIDAPFRLVSTGPAPVERFVQVMDPTGTLVTVIEWVSPSNKKGQGLKDFRRNRRRLLRGGVSFVEIDLVHGGSWRKLMQPFACPPAAVSTYRVIIRTPPESADDEPAGHLYPINLLSPLPDIPIPLRPPTSTVILPLQQVFSTVYDDGRYAKTTDYSKPPAVQLSASDAAAADRHLLGQR
jgi:hypothetical protein